MEQENTSAVAMDPVSAEAVAQPTQSRLEQFLEQKANLVNQANNSVRALMEKNKFSRGDVIRVTVQQQEIINAIDQFLDLLIRDLQIVDGRFSSLEQNLFRIGQQQSIVITALKRKNAITEDEMLTAWNEEVKPQLEQKLAAAKDEAEKTEPLVPEVVV